MTPAMLDSLNPLAPHPLRIGLHNEVHARPPESMAPPLSITHIVMACDVSEREASRAHAAALLRDHHLPPPDSASTHLRADLGALRLRWELHTEFVTWTFSRPLAAHGPADVADSAGARIAQQWLAKLPGRCLAAMQLWVLPPEAEAAAAVRRTLNEETLVGSVVAGGGAEVYTDFALQADGFSRTLILARDIPPRALGRLVQQLLEIETYRMAALLGLPEAREAAVVLGSVEGELAALAHAIRAAGRDEEPQLLDRLTKLAGQVESAHAASHSRLSASGAYFQLVDRRVEDIGEKRLPGLQTLGEFLDRRLSPARATCVWVARRQEALSQRVSRISHLLRTRVEIEQQKSSRGLLAAMNRRQELQLRLQAAVEGLSVAAITYYVVGLLSYLVKGGSSFGWGWKPELVAAGAIPFVAGAVWWSLRRVHQRVMLQQREQRPTQFAMPASPRNSSHERAGVSG
jgi:uncharacterized membrane-anchored protein